MESFEFKQHLYRMGKGLSSPDVSSMKFLLPEEYIPRRQAENIKSAFELFCALADRGLISPTETELLSTLLSDVHKTQLMDPLLSEGGGSPRPTGEHSPPPSTAETHSVERDRSTPAPCPGLRFRRLLKNLGERLSEDEIRNLPLFFSGQNLSLQEIEEFNEPCELFQRLRDCGIISPNDLHRLRSVLGVIGRADLCKLIDDYSSVTEQIPAPGLLQPEERDGAL